MFCLFFCVLFVCFLFLRFYLKHLLRISNGICDIDGEQNAEKFDINLFICSENVKMTRQDTKKKESGTLNIKIRARVAQ